MDFFLRNIEDYDAVTGMSVWKGEDCGEKVLPSITRVWWVCRVAAHLELYLTFSKQVSIFQQILIVCGQFGRKNSGVIFFCHFPITSWRLPWHSDPNWEASALSTIRLMKVLFTNIVLTFCRWHRTSGCKWSLTRGRRSATRSSSAGSSRPTTWPTSTSR